MFTSVCSVINRLITKLFCTEFIFGVKLCSSLTKTFTKPVEPLQIYKISVEKTIHFSSVTFQGINLKMIDHLYIF
jgi:hypothetical protein